jgi:hypothetical protein
VKLVINQFTPPFTVTPSNKPTLGDDTTAPEGAGNSTILAACGEGVMTAVAHNGVLARAGGLSMGGAGLSAGAPDDGGGVSLVACTLSDNDVLAKSGDIGVIGVGLRVGVGATTAVVGCDILTQGLIGLIEYSYHQSIPYFLEAHLQGTPGLSVLGSVQFQNG